MDDSYFRQQYTDIYEFDRKNVKIEIVPAINQSDWRYNDGTEPYKEPDYLDGMKKIMTGVITSYSIHYTKLYDP